MVADALIEPRGGILHVVGQGLELRLERRGVGDEILVPVPEHGLLVLADPPQSEREDDAEQKRHHGDRASGDRNDPSSAGQVMHLRKNRRIYGGDDPPLLERDRERQRVVRRVLLAGHRVDRRVHGVVPRARG